MSDVLRFLGPVGSRGNANGNAGCSSHDDGDCCHAPPRRRHLGRRTHRSLGSLRGFSSHDDAVFLLQDSRRDDVNATSPARPAAGCGFRLDARAPRGRALPAASGEAPEAAAPALAPDIHIALPHHDDEFRRPAPNSTRCFYYCPHQSAFFPAPAASAGAPGPAAAGSRSAPPGPAGGGVLLQHGSAQSPRCGDSPAPASRSKVPWSSRQTLQWIERSCRSCARRKGVPQKTRTPAGGAKAPILVVLDFHFRHLVRYKRGPHRHRVAKPKTVGVVDGQRQRQPPCLLLLQALLHDDLAVDSETGSVGLPSGRGSGGAPAQRPPSRAPPYA